MRNFGRTPHSPLEFQPLEQELGLHKAGRTGGFHSFDKSKIVADFAGNYLVASHEAKHDDLIMETPFGSIQYALRILAKLTASDSLKQASREQLSTLVQASRETHESYATYLSIKEYPQQHYETLISMLPDFYLERYEALSGAIDPVFHSTYVQFLLGKVIVEISMAPPLFRRFARWPNESTIELSTLESPDCRMKSLLDIFKQSSHELLDIIERNTLRQISDMALPEGFSVQDEAAWQSLEPDKSAKLEASLFDSVRGWLYPLAETRFRCLSFDNTWLSEANRFVLRLCQIGDVDPALLTIPMSQRFTMDEVTWRKARRHCLTVVTNHVAEQVSLRPISGQDPMEILTGETPESRVFITESISKGDPEGLQWNCIQQGREGFFSGFKITHDQLSSFLSVRKMLASAGLYIPTIDLIVVGLRFDTEPPSDQLYKELLDYHTAEFSDGNQYFEVDRLIWYMSGDFFKWYDWLVSLGGLEVRFVHGEDQHKAAGRFLETCSDNPTNAEIQDGKKIEVDTPEWVVLRSRSLGGLFLRIMPVGILSGIGPILKEDSDSGRIRTIPQKESEIIANQVIKANMPIRLSWSEF